jgi:hypothetical protein
VLVLPPPRNEKDAEMTAQLLSTLVDLPGPVAFELAGDDQERKLLLRGEPAVLERVSRQLFRVYGQVDTEAVAAADDPALQCQPAAPGSQAQVVCRGLALEPGGPSSCR